jgi:Tol biopolymer transport system component
MTISAPPAPPRPGSAVNHDELIEETRRRGRLRRIGIAACVLAAAVGAAIYLGVHLGGGTNGRSVPSQGGSSGLVALTRVYAGESHIMVVDMSGRSRPRDLGPGWGPSWSPVGRRLVFTYEVDAGVVGRGLGGGLERVFVMNVDGSGRHLLAMPWLVSTRFEDSAPTWSPDGSRIAFTRTVWPPGTAHTQWNPGRSTNYVLNLAHGGPHRLSIPLDGESAYVTWSPDGHQLAYLALASGCIDLHISNADGTRNHIVAAASRSPGAPKGCVPIFTPAWSPDGHWIAFGRPTKPPLGIDLYLISPNGKHLHRLTHQPQMLNVFPTWSPDGKRIAFEAGRPSDRGGPPLRTLAVIDRDGSHRHTILNVRGYLDNGPAWQPR